MSTGEAVEGGVATLTFDQLKLAANRRHVEILRLLLGGRESVNKIAHRCGIPRSSASVTMRRLAEAGLVRQVPDPEREWVYNELTPVGRGLAEADPWRLVVQLGFAVVLKALGGALILWGLARAAPAPQGPWPVAPIDVPEGTPTAPEALVDPVALGWFLVGVGALVAIVAVGRAWWRYRGGARFDLARSAGRLDGSIRRSRF